jgi:ketosteroid isomerase-like protein
VGSYTNTKKERRVNQIGDLRSDIESQVEEFLAAFHRRDAAGVAAIYTEGAKLLPSNAEMITGRQGIQAVWQSMMDSGVKEASLEILELEPMGDKAVSDIGKYHLKIEPEPGVTVEDEGKYVVIWKHDGESWKIDVDIFNTSLPAP